MGCIRWKAGQRPNSALLLGNRRWSAMMMIWVALSDPQWKDLRGLQWKDLRGLQWKVLRGRLWKVLRGHQWKVLRCHQWKDLRSLLLEKDPHLHQDPLLHPQLELPYPTLGPLLQN